MKKKIKFNVIDKKDYYSEDGCYDEIEEYCDDNGITISEFETLQDNINLVPDTFEITEEEKIIQEFLDNVNNPDELIDTDNPICELVYSELFEKYEIEIVDFKVEVVSVS